MIAKPLPDSVLQHMKPLHVLSFYGEHSGPLKRYADTMSALVVDVRSSPWCPRCPSFNFSDLQRDFFPGPSRYVWCPALSLPKEASTPLPEFPMRRFCMGLRALLYWLSCYPCIVICECAPSRSQFCTRTVIANTARSMGLPIDELQYPQRKPLYFRADPQESAAEFRRLREEQLAREAVQPAPPVQGSFL